MSPPLEYAHGALRWRLIRNKKFPRSLIAHGYPIALDGTQKLTRAGPWWGEEGLERRRQTAQGAQVPPYSSVLEANRVFHNGVRLPLLSESLSYAQGDSLRSQTGL
jgi:hypothetical protein